MEDSDGIPAEWQVIADHPHADCRVFSVVRREALHPHRGTRADFYVIKARDWVIALAETPGGQYVLVNQYRVGARKLSWEFPAGCTDPGESPAAAAARELREETGYAGDAGEVIGWCHPNPPLQENTCWYVCIPNARRVAEVDWDAHEELQVAEAPLGELLRMAADGRIFHGVMQAALLYLYRKKEKRT